jgi:zinc protease
VQIGGIKAALLPKGTRGNAVYTQLVLRFGDEKSLFGLNEVPDFVAAMLNKGTRTMTREQLQDKLDQLKTEMSVNSGPGQVSIGLLSRRDTLPQAIALVGEMLRTPSFPADALEETRRGALAGIEQQRKQPEAVAEVAVARAGNPYPRGDVRYARTFDETVADTNAVTLEQIKDFHSRFYGAKKGEFAAVGDFDAEAVKKALQAALGDWDAGMPFTRIPQPIVPVKPERFMLSVPDNQNATMVLRQDVALNDQSEDYPALMMANYLLGSGGNSRMWKRIREGEGLSYDVRTQMDWGTIDVHSEWNATAIFAPQNQAKVEKAFKEELARALKDGFTAQELAEGQRGLLNYRRLGRAQDASIVGGWVRNLYIGQTFKRSAEVDAKLTSLTLDQVNAALRKYVKPDAYVAAFAGDFKP